MKRIGILFIICMLLTCQVRAFENQDYTDTAALELIEYLSDTTGIEFVMTALFVVMFINQWEETDNHRSALTGVFCSMVCLFLFGAQHFIIPAMALIIACFSLMARPKQEAAS